MLVQHVVELRLDPHQRVERIHRALEHHADAPPAHHLQRRFRQFEQVLAVEQDFAACHPGRRLGQPGDRISDRAFAAAGFAGEPEQLAAPDVEGDVLHRPEGALVE